jgi:hypothetical protein
MSSGKPREIQSVMTSGHTILCTKYIGSSHVDRIGATTSKWGSEALDELSTDYTACNAESAISPIRS